MRGTDRSKAGWDAGRAVRSSKEDVACVGAVVATC